ncbi:phage portal protein [Mycolicibacterium sp. XJ775]
MIDRLRGAQPEQRMTMDEYAQLYNQFSFNGIGYGYGPTSVQQTLSGQTTEMAPNNFVGLATHAYQANGVVFACMMVRQLVFSSVRFRYQRVRDGKPSDMFGAKELRLLERPWTGGTTQDMLSRMVQDADLAGNSYWTVISGEFVRMRPDWVDVIVEDRQMPDGRGQVGWRKVGYLYWEGGRGVERDPVALLADEVAHFAPIPDPLASFRGMSWLTPILREIQADQAMTKHQRKFFENGATPNMIIKHNPLADRDAILKWAAELASTHGGVDNAWKNLNLYPGADATVVGANLKDIDFGDVRAGGEVRVAAAAGVPPVIVGLSKGLDSSTYSNYSQARRRLADGTAHPLWENLAGSMEHVVGLPKNPDGSVPDDVRLWYDADNVPFLREDEKDAAEINKVRAETINTLITAGYKPDSVVAAVDSGDFRLLKHTGLTSVQLLPPGQAANPPSNGGSDEGQ